MDKEAHNATTPQTDLKVNKGHEYTFLQGR